MGLIDEPVPAIAEAEPLADSFARIGEVQIRTGFLMGLPCLRAREGLAGFGPDEVERPARIWLPGIVFALGLERDGAGEFALDQGVRHRAGVGELGGAQGGYDPLEPVRLDGDVARLSARVTLVLFR